MRCSQTTFAVQRLFTSMQIVQSVEGVVDHVSIQNGAVQASELRPDHYIWGTLADGRSFEAVGDTMLKVRAFHVSAFSINSDTADFRKQYTFHYVLLYLCF